MELAREHSTVVTSVPADLGDAVLLLRVGLEGEEGDGGGGLLGDGDGGFDPREGVALDGGLAVHGERAGWRKLVSMGIVSLGESAGCRNLEGGSLMVLTRS